MIIEMFKGNQVKLAARILFARRLVKLTLQPGKEGGPNGMIAYLINSEHPIQKHKRVVKR